MRSFRPVAFIACKNFCLFQEAETNMHLDMTGTP